MTEPSIPYIHMRKQIKKRKKRNRKKLEAKCFYGLKKKKQGFGFIAECGGEEESSGTRLGFLGTRSRQAGLHLFDLRFTVIIGQRQTPSPRLLNCFHVYNPVKGGRLI